jgi:hypothetical protein
MKNLKQNKGIRPVEIALWLGYVVLAIASYFPIAHFANVDISARKAIQSDAGQRLAELDLMTDDYERTVGERLTLIRQDILEIASSVRSGGDQAEAGRRAAKYGISPKTDRDRRVVDQYYTDYADRITSDYEAAALTDKQGLKDLEDWKTANRAFQAEHELVVMNWNRGRIYDALNAIDGRVEDYEVYLSDLYADIDPEDGSYWDDEEYTYKQQSASIDNIINSPAAVKSKYPDQVGMLVPIGILLLVHLFVISPYLLLKRFGRRRYYNNPEAKENIGGGGGIEI